MNRRSRFSPDLAALLEAPFIILATLVIMLSFLDALNWIRHPSADSWLWTLAFASAASAVGIVLLFLAKLPQYRVGIFFRFGARDLPPSHQRLYRLSFWFIVPSIVILVALLLAAGRLQ